MKKFILLTTFIIVPFLLLVGNYETIKKEVFSDDQKISCPVKKRKRMVQDNSMAPLFYAGDKVTLLENYYCDQEPKTGDIIIYKSLKSKDTIIRKIKADHQDMLVFEKNYLKINNELLKNHKGEIFSFSEEHKTRFSNFLESGHLPQGMFLIFGENIRPDRDSRIFGPVKKEDFTGKIEFR